MNRYSQLEARLKRAFNEAPEPTYSDDAVQKLLCRIHEYAAPQLMSGVDFSALDSRLRQAFRRRDVAPSEGYDRARDALRDAFAKEQVANVMGIASPAISEVSLNRAGQAFARRMRELENQREEVAEDIFAGLAVRFAAVVLPCSLAVIVFTMLTTSNSMDHRSVIALFEEGHSF